MRILGFWHIATIGQWRMILESQLAKIMASGLYEASHNIFVNIAGTSEAAPLPDAFDNRKFAVSRSRLEQWEYPTLRVLQERARQEEACCWYIHLKGVSHSIEGEQSCVRGWREYMEYFVIENWRLCMEQLVDHDAVGVQWKTGPRPHFSGNFWWANASYRRLASIEDVERVAQGGRHEAEFWIGSGRPRVKCLHAFDRDLYTRIVGREEYREYAESDGDAWADFTTLPSRERILRYANRKVQTAWQCLAECMRAAATCNRFQRRSPTLSIDSRRATVASLATWKLVQRPEAVVDSWTRF